MEAVSLPFRIETETKQKQTHQTKMKTHKSKTDKQVTCKTHDIYYQGQTEPPQPKHCTHSSPVYGNPISTELPLINVQVTWSDSSTLRTLIIIPTCTRCCLSPNAMEKACLKGIIYVRNAADSQDSEVYLRLFSTLSSRWWAMTAKLVFYSALFTDKAKVIFCN